MFQTVPHLQALFRQTPLGIGGTFQEGVAHVVSLLVEQAAVACYQMHRFVEEFVALQIAQLMTQVEAPLIQGAAQALVEAINFALEILFAANDQFGGGGGGGRAQVGHKIADGEVHFVTDGGDQRDAAAFDGAGDHFFIKGPEIFQAAAATANDDDVHILGLVKIVDGAGDTGRGGRSLNRHGRDEDLPIGKAPGEHLEHIADRRAGRGGYDADPPGEQGQGAFAVAVEQPFFLQFLFQFFETFLQIPQTAVFGFFDQNLNLAAPFVGGDKAVGPGFSYRLWVSGRRVCGVRGTRRLVFGSGRL